MRSPAPLRRLGNFVKNPFPGCCFGCVAYDSVAKSSDQEAAMYLNYKSFLMSAAVAVAISGAALLGAVASASAEPGKADPKGPPQCQDNSVVTPSKPCKGNNGFGNGGGDGTPNGKPDDNR